MDQHKSLGPDRTVIEQVYERDVDLMLIEELHCEPDFTSFLSEELFGFGSDLQFADAWNSVTEASLGESDLVVVYENACGRIGLLIENKIRAGFMPDQAERYKLRGSEGISNGWWNKFHTCLLAPTQYLSGALEENEFDFYLSYEKLVPYFRRAEKGRRGRWRAGVLLQAVDGAKGTPYVMRPDKATSDFFVRYWELANREFPELRLKRQDKRPRKSVWIYFSDVGLPKNQVYLVHKANDGCAIDLSFRRTKAEDLSRLVAVILETDMYVQQAKGSAVIRIDTPLLDPVGRFSAQVSEVRKCLESVQRLLHFYRKHADRLKWPISVSA